jgi:hypothetical protein
VFIKDVFGKTHPYALTTIFMLTLVDIWPNEPRFDIRKFQKYLGIFIVLFVGPSHFEFFFRFVFFLSMCLICGLLLLNATMLCNAFFYFHLKQANNNKG